MKVLILDNFFNTSKFLKIIISMNLYKFLLYYRKTKIRNIINKLKKTHDANLKIKIITNSFKSYNMDKGIEIELYTDFRVGIEREEFINTKKKIIKETRTNLIRFYNNLKNINTFHIKNIFIGRPLEFNIAGFFKGIFGQFELLKKILQTEDYDKVIVINFNPYSFIFFKYLNNHFKNIEIYRDKLLNQYFMKSKWFLYKFFLNLLVKNSLIKKSRIKYPIINKKYKNIFFIFNSKNQFNAIKSIYDFFMKEKKFNIICYRDENYIPLKEITNLLRFIFQIKRNWRLNQEKVFKKIEYDSLKLNVILNYYFNFEYYYRMIRFFNNFHHINQFFKYYPPSLVIFADEMKAESRLYSKICKLKKIQTIYIPHGGTPIWPETITKPDFSYISTPGARGKEYLIDIGVPRNNIVITGRPRYEEFYKGKYNQLNEIRDIFNNRKYIFNSNKFTVLFASSPVDFKSREIQIFKVIESLKELNLIDNLIIKLHPREDGIFHKKILNDLNVDPIIVKDYDIFELIKSSKIFLSRTSTTILEAMIIGTPIILLDFVNLGSTFTGKYQFCEEQSLITVRNTKALTNNLQKLITNKNYYYNYSKELKEQAKKYSFYDEKISSTEIIIKLILKILEEQNN